MSVFSNFMLGLGQNDD